MMRNKLRQMKQKSPKDFWNYVNSLNRKTNNSDIKLDSLFDFFKNLNSTEHDDGDDSREELGVPNDSDALSTEVTEDEIINCIKKLKNGKFQEQTKLLMNISKYPVLFSCLYM